MPANVPPRNARHPERRDMPMDVDFGVEVVRAFEPEGEVHAVETTAGEAAVGVHVGSYDRMKENHDAIHAWCAANSRAFSGKSWEIYGDWSDDPAKLETTIVYLLKQRGREDRDLSDGSRFQVAVPTAQS
jgi:hypothetical protein